MPQNKNRHTEREENLTYQTRQQRAYRVVIRNLKHSVQQVLVRQILKQWGTKLKPMQHHTQCHWLPLLTLLPRYLSSSQQQRSIVHWIAKNFGSVN
jgi:hypothetical protein